MASQQGQGASHSPSTVGTVQQLNGVATAILPNGKTHFIKNGEPIVEGESINVLSGSLWLKAVNFKLYELIAGSEITLDGEAVAGSETDELTELQQAIAAGADPTALLEATAAGAEAGGAAAGDNGASFLLLSPAYLVGDVTSGYDTIGPGIGEQQNPEQIIFINDALEENDTPVILFNPEERIVQEDDLANGVNEDGSVNGQFASVDLNNMVDFGNDGPGTFSFALTQAQITTLFQSFNLTSGGVAIDFALLAGNQVTAQAGTTDVFTITITPFGALNFELLAQIDHLPNQPGEELLAQALDISELVRATDADGDSVTFPPGLIQINIQDDVPIENPNADPIRELVEEDGMSVATSDNSEGNKDAGDDNTQDEVSSTAFTNLNSLFLSGTDQPLTFAMNTDTGFLPRLYCSIRYMLSMSSSSTLRFLNGLKPNSVKTACRNSVAFS